MTTMQRRFGAWAQRLARARGMSALLASVLVAFTCLALTAGANAQEPDVDPPGRVARLSDLNGQVWLYNPDAGEWVAASRNRPMTTGDRVATEAGARAELQIGSTTVRIDASSELEVVQLDDEHVALALHDGSAIAHVRDLNGAGQFELSTEDGRFIALSTGLYRFDRINGRSDLTVYSGQGRYEGPNSGLAVNAGQRAEFWIDSGGVAQYSTLAPVSDAFAGWSSERDRRVVGSTAQRYVSPEMTGAAELDSYGRWEQTPDYGSVWIPTAVAADWAPYSQGHWAWVRPWGWTWVDDAPWGFAPFHYGRWVYLRNNWCWTPGTRVARPVYAPALVAWVGGPRGNGSVNIGGGPAVGWFPLAPREVYVPSYRVSPRYARNVNITNVTNVTVINNVFANPQGPREFENRHFPRAITVVPSSVMAERRPVGPASTQYRQTPWVRDFANQTGRTAAMLAPQVATPPMPGRGGNNDPRAVRPPPGARPDAGGGPGFAGRPGFAPRDRNEGERDRERRPPMQESAQGPGRGPEGGGFAAGQRPPAIGQQPIAAQPQIAPAATPSANTPPSTVSRPPPFDRDMRRPEERGPGRMPRDREAYSPVQRPPGLAPQQSPVQPMQPVVPPQQSAIQPMQPVAPPQPTAVQPPRPVVAPAQEGPMMRALPVQRSDERRFEDRRFEDRRQQTPRPEQPVQTQQAPIEQRQAQQPPRVERPAAPVISQPMVPPPAAPRAVEPPRPAPAMPGPVAQPPRPEQQRPQQPESRGDGPRRGDQR